MGYGQSSASQLGINFSKLLKINVTNSQIRNYGSIKDVSYPNIELDQID